jgi:hypothetical protein
MNDWCSLLTQKPCAAQELSFPQQLGQVMIGHVVDQEEAAT